MNIVCASDGNFFPHLAAMLLSLAENNREEKMKIFVLVDAALTGEHEIREMLRRYDVHVLFLSVPSYFSENLQVKNGHVSRTSYVRLLMDLVLPCDISRVIYLDCDLIVKANLRPLWNHDLDGKTAGAVSDPARYTQHSVLGLPPDAPYFNAGVILIDLNRWRSRKIGTKAMEFARRHPERLQWDDQCALNLVLQDDWTSLDWQWNFQTTGIATERNGFIHFRRIPQDVRNSIKIVHFCTSSKPWHYLNDHPMKRDYLKYRQRTPWPLARFEDRTPRSVVRRFLHKRLPLIVRAYYGADAILTGKRRRHRRNTSQKT